MADSEPRAESLARGEPRPFVFTFRTERRFYVYDVNTSRIVLVDPVLWDVVRADDGRTTWADFPARLPQHDPRTVAEAVERYGHFRADHGLFSGFRPKRLLGFRWSDEVQAQYESQMQHLIIELTENCNLRCKYCSYSEYYPLNRGFSRRTIPFETARRAMDFFLSHSEGAELRAIGFYGGEPLLAMNLLEQCVEYGRAHEGSQRIRFSMTTNGTLLTPPVVRRLIDMDVYLLVSIDGPPHCHDLNRVTAGGTGTSSRVIANLEKIRQAEPDYYQTHVGFTSVLAPNASPVDAYLYFTKNPELFSRGILVTSFVSDQNTSYWCENPPTSNWSGALDALRWKYYESLVKGELPKDPWMESLFRDPFLKIYRRGIFRTLPETMSLNGCCQPGVRRLYVACDGGYHMCERINKTIPIGHVDTGLDFERMAKIMDEYRTASEADCSNCWLLRFCPVCFATTVGEGGFDREAKRAQCSELRAQYAQHFTDYCEIAEINPAAFNYMDDIVIQ